MAASMTESYICISPLWDPFAHLQCLPHCPGSGRLCNLGFIPCSPWAGIISIKDPYLVGNGTADNGRLVSPWLAKNAHPRGNDLYLAYSGPRDMAHPCLFSLLWLDEAMFQNRGHGCHGLIDRTLVATAHEKAESPSVPSTVIYP